MTTDPRAHWERRYADHAPSELSWFEPVPQRSLTAINALGLTPDAAILDVGGGASTLAAELVAAGHTDVTVLDLAASALDHAQDQHGGQLPEIKWITADIRDHAFDRRFDLWHDRAVFHFMVSDADRASYVQTLERSLEPRGHVIIATFGPDGPTRCSGLPVHRYGADELVRALPADLELADAALAEHRTPSGNSQQFLHAHLVRRPA